MSPSLIDYLDHILKEIEFINRETASMTHERFLEDEKAKRAIVRSLEIIGEAAKRNPFSYRRKYPQVPWKSISGMRDRLIHGYLIIDYDIVWDVITSKLEVLRDTVEAMRMESDSGS